jgi:hypothetical protein
VSAPVTPFARAMADLKHAKTILDAAYFGGDEQTINAAEIEFFTAEAAVEAHLGKLGVTSEQVRAVLA